MIGEVTGPTLFDVVDQLCEIVAMHESAEEPGRGGMVRRPKDLDCGSNSCQFGGRGKGGMRVNGRCTCVEKLIDDQYRLATLARALAVRTMAGEPLIPNRIELANEIMKELGEVSHEG